MITPIAANTPNTPATETTNKVTPYPVVFAHGMDWYSDETVIKFNTNGIAYPREWVFKNSAGNQLGPGYFPAQSLL